MTRTLRDKNILIISPEPWSHIFVSKHHYAIRLAREGNNVFFLNPPGKRSSISEEMLENLRIVNYTKFPPGLRYFPKILRIALTRGKYKSIQKLCNCTFQIVWSFDNSVFYDLDAIPKDVIKICHIVDLNQDFQFHLAAKSADICLGSTDFIVEKLAKVNANAFFINHGYNKVSSSEKEFQITSLPGKVAVGYAGNLDIPYIDWKLIHLIVDKRSDCAFYFAGKCEDSTILKWMESSSNVQYIGLLPSNELQSFYKKMDVLMIAYKADDFPKQLANPHKVLEYLASGKPIVSTFTYQYKDQSDLIAMSFGNNEWPDKFDAVVDNLDDWTKNELTQKRISLAMNNTYEHQIEKIAGLIEEHIS